MTRRSISLHYILALRTVATVLIVTGLFFALVLGGLQRRAEEGGLESFARQAQQVFGTVDKQFQVYRRYLKLSSALEVVQTNAGHLMNGRALARSLLIEGGPPSVLIGWPNDDLMLVENDGPDMPRGAVYTRTFIGQNDNGVRTQSSAFFTAEGILVSRNEVDTDYRPTSHDWYTGALRSGGQPYLTEPYTFGPDKKYGVALSMLLPNVPAVMAISVDVHDLEQLLARSPLSANGLAGLVDADGRLLAVHTNGDQWEHLQHSDTRLGSLADPGNADLAMAVTAFGGDETGIPRVVTIQGKVYAVALRDMELTAGAHYSVVLLAPIADFTGQVEQAKRDTWLLAFGALALALPLAWVGSRSISLSLEQLARRSQRIEQLDFSEPNESLVSSVREVEMLAGAFRVMRTSLDQRSRALAHTNAQVKRLIKVGIRLVGERDRQSLLHAIVSSAREATGCGSVLIFLREEGEALRVAAAVGELAAIDFDIVEGRCRGPSHLAHHTVATGLTTAVDDAATDQRPEVRFQPSHNSGSAAHIKTLISLPIRCPAGRKLGAIQLFNAVDAESGEIVPFDRDRIELVESLAAQVAVALENFRLIESQQQVMDSLVLTLAGAVDAKSPYTAGHCHRVPELAMQLAHAAHDCISGPLAAFRFERPEQWQEFRIGAWLHDCGKVATPEHVIDKATKLETVHNRIHEIRMRFEVLLRDSRIACLEATLDGRLRPEAAAAVHAERVEQLRDDFGFVAACNIGSEGMHPNSIARLQAVSGRTWVRHFDDRLGLSIAEASRRADEAACELPVDELLIGDKPWHLVPRDPGERQRLVAGFRMEVPVARYNNGELHNLSIPHGTLNAEERFKVNEHITQTIHMLESVPFPEELRRVPEYAGTHHEMLDGSGYPRRLDASQLSVPARIMAIVDIFEALTASDRPYKTAKPLSEALAILRDLKDRGKIDANLFDLFLTSGVCSDYAACHLKPEQIDVADVTVLVDRARAA